MKTTAPSRVRALLSLTAATAATALLLAGCGSDPATGSADGPDGGQRPGAQQIDDSASTSPAPAVDETDQADSPADGTDGTERRGTESTEGADHSPADDDLSDFPLTAGWPEEATEPQYGGVSMPVDQLFMRFDEETCGTSAPDPMASASLRAELRDVEAYLSRELLVFDDADAAVAYVSALDDFYATDACTSPEAAGGEATQRLRRVATEVGGQSFAVVRSTEYEGEPQIGGSALEVVRVGRSVLLDTTWGEVLVRGTGDARELAGSLATSAEDVVAAQCAFTDAGC